MNSKMRKSSSELLALIINIASALLIVIVNRFAPISDEIQFVAILIVVSISGVLFVFRNDVVDKMDERLGLYQVFDRIEDRDLRDVGFSHISSCRTKLEELSRGLLIAPSTELISFLGEKVANARIGVKATLVVDSPESLKQWLNPPASNYYEINRTLVRSGRKFQRIFVLKREKFFQSGSFDKEAGQVILQQKQDGLDVYIVFEEDLRNLRAREDFVIVDRELVQINDTGAVTLGGWRTSVLKSHDKVSEYERKFNTLLAYARTPENVLGLPDTG